MVNSRILQTFEKPQQAQVEITEDENERAIYSTDSDAEIARMLQSEFNNEYNLMLTKTEQKLNGDCKGSLMFLYHTCLAEFL